MISDEEIIRLARENIRDWDDAGSTITYAAELIAHSRAIWAAGREAGLVEGAAECSSRMAVGLTTEDFAYNKARNDCQNEILSLLPKPAISLAEWTEQARSGGTDP